MTTVTIGDVLAIAPDDDRLPGNVKARVLAVWGERDVSEIAAMNVFAAAHELLAVLTDQEGFTNEDRFRAAEGLHDLLKRSGFATETAAPVRVTIDRAKSLAEMDARDLLGLLADEPGRHGEVRPYLDGQPEVRAAQSRTSGAWVIPGASGDIDVEATLAYLGQVSRPHASAQRVFQERRPVTLAAALRLDERAMVHPFTGQPVQGPDANGFDFSQLDPDVHESLLWAAVTGNPAWPAQVDLYTFTEEVFTAPLPRRWQRILDDYRAARAAEEPGTRGITRYWPEGRPPEQAIDLATGLAAGTPGTAAPSRAGAPRASQPASAGYQKLVENAGAVAGALSATGNMSDYNGGIYQRAAFIGNMNTFNGVVFVQGGSITGNQNDGNLLLPPGVRVAIIGNMNEINQRNISWEELAGRLGLT